MKGANGGSMPMPRRRLSPRVYALLSFAACALLYLAFLRPPPLHRLNPLYPHPPPRLIAVTFATQWRGKGFCRTLGSMLANNYDVVALGEGLRLKDNKAKKAKVAGYRSFLEGELVNGEDVVLMVDAYDVYFQRGPSYTLSAFLRLHASNHGAPLVATAEKNCWPLGGGNRRDTCHKAPHSPVPPTIYGSPTAVDDRSPWDKPETAPRWLNAGGMVGFVDLPPPTAVAARVHGAGATGWRRALADISDSEMESSYDDQEVWLGRHIDRKDGMVLDYWGEIFHSMQKATQDLEEVVVGMDGPEGGRALWTNKHHAIAPATIHFNGEGKEGGHMERLWKGLWFVKEDVDLTKAGYKFRDEKGKWHDFAEYCGNMTDMSMFYTFEGATLEFGAAKGQDKA